MTTFDIPIAWKRGPGRAYGLDVIVHVEDYDFDGDEFVGTAGWIEIDYVFSTTGPHPADRWIEMWQAQFDDEPEHYFDLVIEDPYVAEAINERIYSHKAEEAERFADERDDYLYHWAKESRRVWR